MDEVKTETAGLEKQRIEILIQQARQGSSDALGELLDECRLYLLGAAQRAISTPLRVKVAPSDLVQETSLDAQRDFAQFRGECLEELLRWLRSILDCNVLSAHRRYQGTQKRRLTREVPLDLHPIVAGELRDNAPSPPSLLATIEDQERLERAIASLPEDLRTAVILRSQKHNTFAEIGIEMQRSAEAARKLWGRGVIWLQQELAKPNGHQKSR